MKGLRGQYGVAGQGGGVEGLGLGLRQAGDESQGEGDGPFRGVAGHVGGRLEKDRVSVPWAHDARVTGA